MTAHCDSSFEHVPSNRFVLINVRGRLMIFRSLMAWAVFQMAVGTALADESPSIPDLIRQLETGTSGERVIAAELLGERGPKAVEAITALAKVLNASKLPDPTKEKVPVDRNEILRFFSARDALVRIGPKAVPALDGLFAHESVMVRYLVTEAVGWMGPDAAEVVPSLVKLLREPDPAVRKCVIDSLSKIGAKADPAIPALLELIGDPKGNDVKGEATHALISMGPKGKAALKEKILPELIKEYETSKPMPSYGPGISVLMALGKDSAPALPAIKDYILRREQHSDLDPLGPTLLELGPDGVKAFLEVLADKKADRRAMIGSIGTSRAYSFRADLTPLIPTLLAALKDENKSLRSSAAWALSFLGDKTPPEVIEAMVAGLADPTVDNVAAFARVGENAVPALIKAVNADDDKMKRNAINALAKIGCAAQPSLPALRNLAQSKDMSLAILAAAAAARISLDPKDAATVFQSLKEGDVESRLKALGHVRELGPLALPYQKGLIALLDDKDIKVKELVIKVIAQLGSDAPEAIAALAESLPPTEKWGFLLNGYGKPFGETFKPAVPTLIKALSDPKEDVCFDACRLLRQIGPEAKDAVPALIQLLGVSRQAYRVNEVLAALEAIGAGAKSAVPLLARAASYPQAALCLGGIGPAAKDAVPALQKCLADPEPNVRLAATCALARIESDVSKYRDTFARMMLPPLGDRANILVLPVFDKLAPDVPELIPYTVALFPKLTQMTGASLCHQSGSTARSRSRSCLTSLN
jgi:HEAT repeat protein